MSTLQSHVEKWAKTKGMNQRNMAFRLRQMNVRIFSRGCGSGVYITSCHFLCSERIEKKQKLKAIVWMFVMVSWNRFEMNTHFSFKHLWREMRLMSTVINWKTKYAKFIEFLEYPVSRECLFVYLVGMASDSSLRQTVWFVLGLFM